MPFSGRIRAAGWLLVALATAALFGARGSAAQPYPSKTIRLVAPFSTGPFQILAHVIAEPLTETIGQPVVVDYRPGAGGNIGAEIAAKSAPDGHTLALLSASHAVAPVMSRSVKYDVLRDFAPITLLATVPNVLVVHPSLPVRTLKELAQLARANPNKLTYGSGGTGSFNHVGNELFRTLARAEIVHVPYKGGSIALNNILTGEVDMVVVTVPSTIPFIESRRLRALAVLSKERQPALPAVPTAAEAGMPELVVVSWYGIAAPAGVRAEIIGRLNAEIVKVMRSADVKQRLAKLGMEPATSTPREFADYMRAETEKWTRVIRQAKIQLD